MNEECENCENSSDLDHKIKMVRQESGVDSNNEAVNRGQGNIRKPEVKGEKEDTATGISQLATLNGQKDRAMMDMQVKRECQDRATAHLHMAAVKEESQDRATASLHMAAVKGESQDRATASLHMAAVKGESQDRATASLHMAAVKRESEDRATASLHMAAVKRESEDRASGSLDLTIVKREDKKVTTRSTSLPAVKKEVRESSTRILKVPVVKGDFRERAMKSLTVPQVKGEIQDSATLNSRVPPVMEETLGNATGSVMVTPVKEEMEESAMRNLTVPPVKGKVKDNATDILQVTAVNEEIQNSAMGKSHMTGIKKEIKDIDTGNLLLPAIKREIKNTATESLTVPAGTGNVKDSGTGTPRMPPVKDDIKDNVIGNVSMSQVKGEIKDNAAVPPIKTQVEFTAVKGLSVPVVKGEIQDTATRSTVESSAKGEGQDSTIESSGVASVREKIHDCAANILRVPPVKGGSQDSACRSLPGVKKENQDHATSSLTERPGKHKSQNDASGRLVLPDVKEDNATGSLKVPPVKKEKQDSATRNFESVLPIDKEDSGKISEGRLESMINSSQETPQRESEIQDIRTEGEGTCLFQENCPFSIKESVLRSTMKGETVENGNIDEYKFVSEDGEEGGECHGTCGAGKKPHKCCQCDTSFRTPYELSRHGRVHSGERPYQCHLCHRCFKRKDHVEVHTRRHVEDRRHVCGSCGTWFVTSSCLLRHRRRTHQETEGQVGTGHKASEADKGDTEASHAEDTRVDTKDDKDDSKETPTYKDPQKNGRRPKKTKLDSTYRPGGKTVCIIKKRNLRQRSYSFVELEDDVECFESDEEDKIPYLKIQDQRVGGQRVEEEREDVASHLSELEHSLFPPSFFSQEASMEHLILLGEVSRLLSHSLVPSSGSGSDPVHGSGPGSGSGTGPTPTPTLQEGVCHASVGTQVGGGWAVGGLGDSDDSDCDPPLVACDVTFLEAEGEVTSITPLDGTFTASTTEDTPQTPSQSREGELSTAQLPNASLTTPTQEKEETLTLSDKDNTLIPHNGGKSVALQTEEETVKATQTIGYTDGRRGRPWSNDHAVMSLQTAGVMLSSVDTNGKKEIGKGSLESVDKSSDSNEENEAWTSDITARQPKGTEIKKEDTLKDNSGRDTQESDGKEGLKGNSNVPHRLSLSENKRNRKASQNGGSKRRKTCRESDSTSEGEEEGEKGVSAPQRPHKCHLCHFKFRSATELRRHVSTHSGERPFLCELCGAGFMRKCHLQLHVRRHSGERRHACQECRMRFFTPSDLTRHQAIHQDAEKPLQCHLCHLSFRRLIQLEQHIRHHVEATPFACGRCGALFSTAAALRSHDRHHTASGPHPCPDCSAAFTTATALSRHRRVHTDRHHRLLKAMELQVKANTRSSYECVSSEGSPLSLVIRKVAGTGLSHPDLEDPGGEEGSRDSCLTSWGTEIHDGLQDTSDPPYKVAKMEVTNSELLLTQESGEGKGTVQDKLTLGLAVTKKDVDENKEMNHRNAPGLFTTNNDKETIKDKIKDNTIFSFCATSKVTENSPLRVDTNISNPSDIKKNIEISVKEEQEYKQNTSISVVNINTMVKKEVKDAKISGISAANEGKETTVKETIKKEKSCLASTNKELKIDQKETINKYNCDAFTTNIEIGITKQDADYECSTNLPTIKTEAEATEVRKCRAGSAVSVTGKDPKESKLSGSGCQGDYTESSENVSQSRMQEASAATS